MTTNHQPENNRYYPSRENTSSNTSSRQSRQLKKSKPNWLLMGFCLSAIAIVSASIGAVLALSLSKTPFRQARLTPQEEAVFNQEETVTYSSLDVPQLSRPVNILVLGVKVLTSDLDDNPYEDVGYHALVNSFEGLSDTMLLLRFDPEKEDLAILSIPRDTKTLVPGHGITKINSANYHGGPALTAEAVGNLLDGVEIDRYVRVNVQGIEKLIDALGGVDIFVPKDMKYTDESQHLYINLKKGQQKLNGEKAVEFLRFRYDAYGDIGRIQRQQSLIRALKEQTINPRTILRLPEILSVVRAHLDTNLTTNELMALASFAGQKNRSDFKLLMLPGDFNIPEEGELSYWLPDSEKITDLVTTHFDVEPPYHYNYYSAQNKDVTDLKIVVQYNNEDNQEKGLELVRYLQSMGYNRVFLSQKLYSQPLTETRIVAQQGDNHSAFKVRHDLGLGEVVIESTGVLSSDITIQLAPDWQPNNETELETEEVYQDFQTTSF